MNSNLAFFFPFHTNALPSPRSQLFFPTFFPKYFIVLPFTFKTVWSILSQFLYTVYILCEGSFSAHGCPVAPGPLVQTLSIFHWAHLRYLLLGLCFIPLFCVSPLCLDVSTCVYTWSYTMSWSRVDWFFPLLLFWNCFYSKVEMIKLKIWSTYSGEKLCLLNQMGIVTNIPNQSFHQLAQSLSASGWEEG